MSQVARNHVGRSSQPPPVYLGATAAAKEEPIKQAICDPKQREPDAGKPQPDSHELERDLERLEWPLGGPKVQVSFHLIPLKGAAVNDTRALRWSRSGQGRKWAPSAIVRRLSIVRPTMRRPYLGLSVGVAGARTGQSGQDKQLVKLAQNQSASFCANRAFMDVNLASERDKSAPRIVLIM